MTEYFDLDVRRRYKKEEGEELFELDKEFLLEVGHTDPPDPPPVGGDIPYSEGEAGIILKNVGSSDHPFGYTFETYYTKVGRKVNLDIRLFFDADYSPGSGGDEFWIDLDGPDKILPDFNVEGCLESVGVFHAWHGGMLEGNAYWSKNVGSGLDGIRMTYGGEHIAKNYPYVWGASDHWRISIAYTV